MTFRIKSAQQNGVTLFSRIRLVAVTSLFAFVSCSTLGLAQQMQKEEESALAQAVPEKAAPGVFALASGPKAYLADVNGKLGTLDLGNGSVHVIGSMGRYMTDIAFCPGGKLFGIYNFNQLYRINPANAQKTLVGSTGISLNALVCSAAGTLLAMGPNTTNLYRLNSTTGKATSIGNTGYRSAGDLAFYQGGLFLTSTDKKLVKLNPANGAPIAAGYHGITDLWGLITVGNQLWGFAFTRAFLFTANGIYYGDFPNQGLSKTAGAAFK